MTPEFASRFWAKVNRQSEKECWEWNASVDTRGYGNVGVPQGDGSFLTQRSHRVSWMLTHGGVLGRKDLVCHTCDNRRCVNPAHLFLGDHLANNRDCLKKGRWPIPRGEANGRAILTAEQVADIRASFETVANLAKKYGLSKSAMADAKRGKSWRDVA